MARRPVVNNIHTLTGFSTELLLLFTPGLAPRYTEAILPRRISAFDRAEGALRISATTPVGPARVSPYGRPAGRPTFHACAVILQTHVEVPDRPSNRGVFPGGPEVQEILIGSRGPRPGGT